MKSNVKYIANNHSTSSSKSTFFSPVTIQPKLTIGQPNDKYEQEADAMADKVMRMPQTSASLSGVQTKPLANENTNRNPSTKSGGDFLTKPHSFTNFVQRQINSPFAIEDGEATDGVVQTKPLGDTVKNLSGSPRIQRVNWAGARDTGNDTHPWRGLPYNGDVYEVETNAGSKINAWKPHDGTTYWCHGLTFGGSTAAGGPFSIWGQDVPTVLNDDGWRSTYSCLANDNVRTGRDILVFRSGANVAHTGIISSTVAPNATIDESLSRLDSKWGPAPRNNNSWAVNAGAYGKYKVYSKNPAQGPCRSMGPNEE